jgi:hypothetical protein
MVELSKVIGASKGNIRLGVEVTKAKTPTQLTGGSPSQKTNGDNGLNRVDDPAANHKEQK